MIISLILLKYSVNFYFSVQNSQPTADKKALKIIRLQERGINVLTTTEKYEHKKLSVNYYTVKRVKSGASMYGQLFLEYIN